MKTSRQIRCENARSLAVAGPAEFARKVSDFTKQHMSNQYANQIIGPSAEHPIKGRGIGDDVARRIEATFGKEEGWLDHEWSANPSISGHKSVLSDEAKSLILCVERLDGLGDLARKTFALHTGLLVLSSAAAGLHTDLVTSQMLAELERIGAPQSESSGATTNERKHRK